MSGFDFRQAQPMPQSAAPSPQGDADQLKAATEQAIAACGGNARDAVKALLVTNEFLESEVCDLMQAVSHAYARGRFNTYTG
jgi:stage V sporulation protein SpoVS